MNLQQLVVLPFISVLQLHHSECKLHLSFDSNQFDITFEFGQRLITFFESFKDIFDEDRTESTTEYIIDSTSPQEEQQRHNVLDDSLKEIYMNTQKDNAGSISGETFNQITWPEGLSDIEQRLNLFVDSLKEIFDEDGTESTTEYIVDSTSRQQEQRPNVVTDSLKEIYMNTQKDNARSIRGETFNQITWPEGLSDIEQRRNLFVDSLKEIFDEGRTESTTEYIVDSTSRQQEQRPNVVTDSLKEIYMNTQKDNARSIRGETFNQITWPEGLSDIEQRRNLFVDSLKEIFDEGRTESTTEYIVDSTSRQEEQRPSVVTDSLKEIYMNTKKDNAGSMIGEQSDEIFDPTSRPEGQSMNNVDVNEIIFNGARDDFIEPEEQMENKPFGEDLIVHMTSMTPPQLITMHGYPAESHTIVTDDGYILTIHRIPYSKNNRNKISSKKTVLLHHGMIGSSSLWLIPGPMKGLGYILSDAGYDVWMANLRGHTYSNAHVSRNVKSFEFWNFTFHEVSQHDLPAVIDYIMEVKGGDVKINYIGHSMGTTVLFAMLSTKTQYNKVLRAGFALAPVAYMTNVKGPIKELAKYSKSIHSLMTLFGGANELLPKNQGLKWLSEHSSELLRRDKKGKFEDVMSILFGHDAGQFNKTLLPLILGQCAGASTKTLFHYAQEIQQRGKFQMFDNGPAGNIKAYGTKLPPEYPLHKITLPIALFSSENDWLSSVDDARNLYKQLVNPIDHYIVPLKEFNHADFLWAIDAPTLLYARLLQLLEEDVSKLDSNVDILDDNLLDKADIVTEEYN